jgi:hypothetical protein
MDALTVVGIVLFVILAAYAVWKRQPIAEIALGNALKAKFKDPIADATVEFSVFWEWEPWMAKAQAMLTVSGSRPVTLRVDPQQRFQTVSIRVARPGNYAYSVEEHAIMNANDPYGNPAHVPVNVTGKGLIDVQPGSAFHIRSTFVSSPRGATINPHLAPVTENPLQRATRGTQEDLDRLIAETELDD